MLPKEHALYGFFAALFSMLLFDQIEYIWAIVFLIATIGIDVDHYLWYIYKKRDLNLRKSVQWFYSLGKIESKIPYHKKNNFSYGIYILHGPEIILILLIVSMYSWIAWPIIFGFLFHQVLDFLDILERKMPFSKLIGPLYSWRESRKKSFVGDF